MNAHAMERYCEELLELLWDTDRTHHALYQALDVIDLAADKKFHRDNIRSQSFTDKVVAIARDREFKEPEPEAEAD